MPNRVVIYGGRGGLGSTLVKSFKSKGWWVCSIDLAANDEADVNVLVNPKDEWLTQESVVTQAIQKHVGSQKVDSILNMAGGWAGGSASSEDFIKNSDLMWKQSVWSSTISARLASKHLKEGGCLVLPGAQPALGGTPGMMGYGMAKAAIHQLTKSLASADSGLPSNATAFALLPITLDTPMNRKFMPDADHSKWTPLQFISDLLFKWSEGLERPTNGSLVQLVTTGGETQLVCN